MCCAFVQRIVPGISVVFTHVRASVQVGTEKNSVIIDTIPLAGYGKVEVLSHFVVVAVAVVMLLMVIPPCGVVFRMLGPRAIPYLDRLECAHMRDN